MSKMACGDNCEASRVAKDPEFYVPVLIRVNQKGEALTTIDNIIRQLRDYLREVETYDIKCAYCDAKAVYD